MKTNSTFKLIFAVSISSLLLLTCDPTNPNNPNDQEVITSLQITAVEGSNTYSFEYSDPDGNGGNLPTIDTVFLTASTVYSISLNLLDETKDPVDTITTEVEEEGVDHQFFFTIAGANLTNTYADLDVNGMPIGIVNTWTTGLASNGTITITLRHEPIKDAPNVSSGDITQAGGETDVEVTFVVIVQ